MPLKKGTSFNKFRVSWQIDFSMSKKLCGKLCEIPFDTEENYNNGRGNGNLLKRSDNFLNIFYSKNRKYSHLPTNLL